MIRFFPSLYVRYVKMTERQDARLGMLMTCEFVSQGGLACSSRWLRWSWMRERRTGLWLQKWKKWTQRVTCLKRLQIQEFRFQQVFSPRRKVCCGWCRLRHSFKRGTLDWSWWHDWNGSSSICLPLLCYCIVKVIMWRTELRSDKSSGGWMLRNSTWIQSKLTIALIVFNLKST